MIRFLLFVLGALYCFSIQAQTHAVVSNAGDFSANTNGSISWTLGEVITESFSNTTGQLNQGFHNFNIIISEIPQTLFSESQISIFPNPSSSFITICFSKITDFAFYLSDSNGRVVLNGKEKLKNYDINIFDLKSGIYFLKIIEDNNLIRIYKIEKI